MNIKISRSQSQFGEMIFLESKDVKIGLTNEMGARVSYISAFGSGNICFFDEKYKEVTRFPNGVTWKQLGGHRMWKTPEDIDCYAYDNEKVELTTNQNKAEFLYPIRGDKLQFAITLEFVSDTEIVLTHKMTNLGDKVKKVGLWAITAMNVDGETVLPLSKQDTSFLPNRNIVFWPYTDIKDDRLTYFNDKVVVKGKPNTKPLKIGVYNKDGVATYTNNYFTFVKTVQGIDNEHYPDYFCNLETYTNSNIMEIETLSPTYEIQPNQTKTHIEKWSFVK